MEKSREDQSRIRIGYGIENMAHLRIMALNLLKKETITKAGFKAKKKKAGWDREYLLKLLFLFDKRCDYPAQPRQNKTPPKSMSLL